jgi:hypothetical protein
MGRIKELIGADPLRKRQIEFCSYPLERERLIVEGWFRDERLVRGYAWNGRELPPGVVHLMCVRLLLGEWPLLILDAEAEMIEVPYDMCVKGVKGVERIKGLRIASGFSEEVFRRIGGAKGCTHLTHLVVAAGPAAIHGFRTFQTQARRPLPSKLEEIEGIDFWIDSCHVWRKNGKLIQKIESFFDERPKRERDISS